MAAQLAIPAVQLEAARLWAASIRDQSVLRQTESQIEGRFQHSILETVLGYKPFGEAGTQTYKPKQAMGRGTADIALGDFSGEFPKIIAPFELKGAGTRDLDAPMAGPCCGGAYSGMAEALPLRKKVLTLFLTNIFLLCHLCSCYVLYAG